MSGDIPLTLGPAGFAIGYLGYLYAVRDGENDAPGHRLTAGKGSLLLSRF